MIDATPYTYARSIAYLGDASTVRVRTLDYFGRAPSLAVCERIVAERRGEPVNRKVRNAARDQAIREARKAGASVAELARRYRLSQDRVADIARGEA